MLFSDLQTLFEPVVTEIICDGTVQFHRGEPVRIEKQDTDLDVYIFGEGILTGVGKFASGSCAQAWSRVQGQEYLAQIEKIEGKRLRLQAATGFFLRHFNRPLSIAVADGMLKGDSLKNFQFAKLQIEQDYLLTLGGERYAVIGKHIGGDSSSLVLVNGSRCYTVTETTRRECGMVDEQTGSDHIYAITKGERPFRRDQYVLELWKCSLDICDATFAQLADQQAQAFLDKGLEKYLSVWRQYTQIEYEFIQRTAEKAGKLHYTEPERDGTRGEVTLRITNPECLDNFQKNLDELGGDRPVKLPDEVGTQKTRWVFGTLKQIDPNGKRAVVSFEERDDCYKVMASGVILPNLQAAKTQYDRREAAFRRIFRRESAKPQLAMLISGQDVNGRREKKKMSPLSDEVIQKCFGGRMPTEAQRTAIEIALNTPDFAIIQGPPGTGKTTVINGIMTALSEKEKDPDLFFGKNLLTAYQRDATDHLAEKLRIYDLPVITYKGRRAGGQSENGISGGGAVAQWIQEKRQALEEDVRNDRIKVYAETDVLVSRLKLLLASFHTETASREMCRSLLLAYQNAIAPFARPGAIWSGEGYSARADRMLEELERDIQGNELSRARRGLDRQTALNLPTSKVSMEDDGPDLVDKAVRRFSNARYPELIQTIASALEQEYAAQPVAYRRVKILKNRLLAELREKNGLLSNNRLNCQAAELLEGTIRTIEAAERSDEDRIMTDYWSAFSDEETIQKSIEEFLTVIAATHQKATSKEVSAIQAADAVTFENVLIDEAARSCPPDLLIPLSCARDRMILVGDHKQLPQFVSDKVYDAIDSLAEEDKRSIIKDKPMFLHLIEQVRKLEAADGVKRFIQLDAQYRMPKRLGDLVSECFYDGKLNSPLGNDGEQFQTRLKYIEKYHLVWLDVPGRPGERERRVKGGSRQRPEEASRIVKMLRSVLEGSEKDGVDTEKYSYGVMTFYRGQKELLDRLIYGDGYLCHWADKIKVGTVDSFQGMEFDVVFLSLVRSNTDYMNQKKRFGFTADERRLCVALSRAKRCMIIAGDSQMMEGEEAASAIPALVRFYQLCSSKEVRDACVYKASKDRHISAPEEG